MQKSTSGKAERLLPDGGSYRTADNRVCYLTILNVGFVEDVTPEHLNKIQTLLSERYENKKHIFQIQDDHPVKKYIEVLWQCIVSSKKLALVPAEKLTRMVNMDTLQQSNAREVGTEIIAYQTRVKLQLLFFPRFT